MDSVDGTAVKVTKNVLPCTLDKATNGLIKLIFSNDMFKEAMACMNLGGCDSVHFQHGLVQALQSFLKVDT